MMTPLKITTVVSRFFMMDCFVYDSESISAKYTEVNITKADIKRAKKLRELVNRPTAPMIKRLGTIPYNDDVLTAMYDVAYNYVGLFGLKRIYDLFIERSERKNHTFITSIPNYKEELKATFEYVLKVVEKEAMGDGENVPAEYYRESFLYDDVCLWLKGIEVNPENLAKVYEQILCQYRITTSTLFQDHYFKELISRAVKEYDSSVDVIGLYTNIDSSNRVLR